MSKIAGPWDAANWAVANPILDNGEEGIETNPVTRSKIGDGVTRWNALPYASGTQPEPNVVELAHDVALIVNAGVPDATVGAGYAGKGALCLDSVNGNLYVNAGTKTAPSWKLASSGGGGGGLHLLNSLVSYWKMDEASGTRNDSVGTNHLTIGGGVIPSGAGKINNAAAFSSIGSEELTCASNSTLQVANTGDFTFSFWIKTTVSGALQYIINKIQPSVTTEYNIWGSAGPTGFFAFDIGTVVLGTDRALLNPFDTTAWTHLVCWYDHLTGQVYLRANDSVTVQSTTSQPLVTGTGPLMMGVQGSTFMDALLDEVGFWKRVLTAAEITALYNAGAGLPFSSFTA